MPTCWVGSRICRLTLQWLISCVDNSCARRGMQRPGRVRAASQIVWLVLAGLVLTAFVSDSIVTVHNVTYVATVETEMSM